MQIYWKCIHFQKCLSGFNWDYCNEVSNALDFCCSECACRNRAGLGEFVLLSVQKQAERKSSRKNSTCLLLRLSDCILFLQIFMSLGCFFSICCWWLEIPWIDMYQYQQYENDLRLRLFFYFGLYSMISVKIIGPHHCAQGFVPGCGQGGPWPVFSFYRYLYSGSDIHSQKATKKKKSAKRENLKTVNHVSGAANDRPSAASTMPVNVYLGKEQHEF